MLCQVLPLPKRRKKIIKRQKPSKDIACVKWSALRKHLKRPFSTVPTVPPRPFYCPMQEQPFTNFNIVSLKLMNKVSEYRAILRII